MLSGSLDCWLDHRLLPDSAFLNGDVVPLNNTTLVVVTIEDVQISLIGERTNFRITNAQVAPPKEDLDFPARSLRNLHLTIHRDSIPPDHYTGSLYLTLAGRDDQIVLPVDITMRTGASLALLALFIGIILGRLLKFAERVTEGETRGAQSLSRPMRFIAFVTGVDTAGAKSQIIVRFLLWIALIVLLVFVGMKTLYVEQGVTFGAGGFADYLSLIVWGLSADVAGRTLANLGGKG